MPETPPPNEVNEATPAQKIGEGWGSRIGVILAVAGSAVGLGNFLRFPGQAAQNGGGAFMIPYFISLLVLGIPLCWAEWVMGRHGGSRGFNSAPGIFSVIWPHRLSKYLAMPALLIPLVIYMYYVVIEAWCLGYAWSYLTGDLMLGSDPQAYGAFFDKFVGAGEDGALLKRGGGNLMWLVVITFVLNFILIYRGVARGIETFCKVAIPAMAICALIVLTRVLTLPPDDSGRTILDGLGFMWNPDFKALAKPSTWLAASGQIFFSLSVGFGVIINYSSYLKRKDDVVLSGLTASSMNEFFEVCLGGLITIPAAFLFLGATVGDQGTFGLGFNALPNVFAEMPAGRFFGFLWFFMLFLAAITSSLSMLQPVIAFFEEGFDLPRPASASLLGLISALGSGFILYFSKGMVALDTFDFWIGTTLIVILALIQSILYGWKLGIDRGAKIAAEGAKFPIPRLVQYLLKYFVPTYLIVILAVSGYKDLGPRLAIITEDTVALSSISFIAVVGAFLLILIHVAGRRWRDGGKLEFDEVEEDGAGI
ncbi:sodium-dependent transporter [Botrimarina mediterranea]|uniref:Sodium:neurotransmitter symporter family protein n=1 Tax=Botrimarina mediterranea TaxID=2528022 RepID=A0A518KAT2_9BACT|nr:sodium-dependent transporter [Botrimarina mediterranea]QDV74899.1 Sodium:neurotransmitter symporter family protein [Botrimarina mediterranea]QDV79542.1 Sodium:neurotransmitter symporter family protein [Planctomycetes bacterium K2D]